jgi:hypothetical protein
VDTDSNHHLLIAEIRLKTASVSKIADKKNKKYNTQTTREIFACELQSRFHVLQTESESDNDSNVMIDGKESITCTKQ